MEAWMLAGLTNRFQPSDSLLKLNLVHPKVLQDVSCRNSELPVERLELPVEKPGTSCRKLKTSCRKPNSDLNVTKS